MRIHEREEGRPRRGDRVHAFAAGKDGWGIVEAVVDGGVHVHFPDVPYPQTLCQPTGDYFVPWERIVKVERAAAPALPGESPMHDLYKVCCAERQRLADTLARVVAERDELAARRHPKSCSDAAERLCAAEAASDALRKAAQAVLNEAANHWKVHPSVSVSRDVIDALRAALGDEGTQR